MTEEKSIRDRVREVVASQLGLSDNQFTDNARIKDDLGADSLDTTELIMELEEEFDLNISDDAAENVATVGDAIRFLEELASEPQD